MSAPPSPTILLQRVLAGDDSPDLFAWFTRAVRTWERAGGDLRLERCLGLPTPRQQRVERQAYFLRIAAAHAPPDLAGRTVHDFLAHELAVLMTRGPMSEWRSRGGPPADADPVRKALFDVACNLDPRARPLCARTIARALTADTKTASRVGEAAPNFPQSPHEPNSKCTPINS